MNPPEYLYFPNCRIARTDHIPNKIVSQIMMHIKSTQNTPSHYPKHFMLEGKVEVIAKMTSSFILLSPNRQTLKEIIDFELDFHNTSRLKQKKISILVKFDENANVKLRCISIGKPFEKTTLHLKNAEDSNIDIEKISLFAYLNWNIDKKSVKKETKIKI